MRTTITIEPDIDIRLKRFMRDRGLTFKAAVNEALRSGLDHERPPTAVERYVLPVRDMGLRPGIDLDKARHLDADLEDEETLRKLALRK